MRRYFVVFISLYTIFLLYMMFFASGREASEVSYLQMRPFITIQHFFTDDVDSEAFLVNIIGNVFVFSPFGWLGLCVRRFNSLVPITGFFLVVITIIESIQYISGRGVADIDDVFLNTLGMCIGFILFKYATWKNIANIRFHFELLEDRKSLKTA
ncbi:VanZ family protein [Chryseobacterium foetidum]|uniref:VanZ family protein n=1 Tax=Chryseobacterium foetidum TaxID=2951057 RepID=UPI0021C950DD|nr:VanZ family protein [Chryseobacterium foetidum]